MQLFDKTAYKTSKLITENYSTSFSHATSLLNKNHREAIYAIYGFVRFADEIVDTFHDWNKKKLLEKFEQDLDMALEMGISLNPVLHAFQLVVKKYDIPDEYIRAFLNSMNFDLDKKQYKTLAEADEYIYGSADVVGLMCLRVFCDGNNEKFEQLKNPAMKLGSAFQKVNFLRDIKNDIENLGRTYFPQLNEAKFNDTTKKRIIDDIKADFSEAYKGIKLLPNDAKLAVFLAYSYYLNLLKKIENSPSHKILENRIRISNFTKLVIYLKAKLVFKLKQI
jgi:phytoene/squalene synthetase